MIIAFGLLVQQWVVCYLTHQRLLFYANILTNILNSK
nr:MAG TPA: UAF complex subunit [Caudoviricetes sp.]